MIPNLKTVQDIKNLLISYDNLYLIITRNSQNYSIQFNPLWCFLEQKVFVKVSQQNSFYFFCLHAPQLCYILWLSKLMALLGTSFHTVYMLLLKGYSSWDISHITTFYLYT